VEFIYRNLGIITRIHPTLDTHLAAQIFHPIFWVNESGEHPSPGTMISAEDVKAGTWRVNPAVTFSVTGDPSKYSGLERYALHYVSTLSQGGKFPLMIWPFHAMLGGHGHALVPSVEEAIFFHNIARSSQTDWQIKGGNPLTENYSVLAPEVLSSPNGSPVAQKNTSFIEALMNYDAVIVAGQAKSHCVAWTVRHLLDEIAASDPQLASKVYLLVDCMSPVVIPGVIDFTDQAEQVFTDFAAAGMKLVNSTDPIDKWPGMADLLKI
jgi:nicotinamidase-related amidase